MLISPQEIKKSLSSYKWNYLNGKIIKKFEFDTYLAGLSFAVKIGELAEKHNHHPEIKINYCLVEILIYSHQFNGVTTKCVNLATEINLLKK